MGTRTWTRRGVMTAAGRRRAGLTNQDMMDIFGEDVPPNPTAVRYDGIRKRAIRRILQVLGRNGLRRPTDEQMQKLRKLAMAMRQMDARLSRELGDDPETRRWRDTTEGLPKAEVSDRYIARIVQEELAKGTRTPKGQGGRPVAVLMMGGPGSGKSTMRQQLFSDAGYVKVDNDEIKERIPHYWVGVANSDRNAAKRVHSLAGDIVHELTDKAIRGRYNVIIDGTGRYVDGMMDTIARLQKRGYEIRLLMPHTPLAEGQRRAAARAEQTGRWLNPDFLANVYPDVAANFTALVPFVDKAVLHDSMTGKRISTYTRGRRTYNNPALYDDFDQLAQLSGNYGMIIE